MLNIQKKRLLNLVTLPIFLGLSYSLQGTPTYNNPVDLNQSPLNQRNPFNGKLFAVKVGLTTACMIARLKYAQNNPDSSTANRALALLPATIFYGFAAKDIFEITN